MKSHLITNVLFRFPGLRKPLKEQVTTSPILLYQIVCHGRNNQIAFPVGQMLSQMHDMEWLSHWLSVWKHQVQHQLRKQQDVVAECVLDESAALIGACVAAFTQDNIGIVLMDPLSLPNGTQMVLALYDRLGDKEKADKLRKFLAFIDVKRPLAMTVIQRQRYTDAGWFDVLRARLHPLITDEDINGAIQSPDGQLLLNADLTIHCIEDMLSDQLAEDEFERHVKAAITLARSAVRFLRILFRNSPIRSNSRFAYMRFFPFGEYLDNGVTGKRKLTNLLSIYTYGGCGCHRRTTIPRRNAEVNKLAKAFPNDTWTTLKVFEDDQGDKVWMLAYIERMLVQLPSLSLPMCNIFLANSKVRHCLYTSTPVVVVDLAFYPTLFVGLMC